MPFAICNVGNGIVVSEGGVFENFSDKVFEEFFFLFAFSF